MRGRALAVAVLTGTVAFAGLVCRAETVRIVPSPGAFYAPSFRNEASGPGAVLNAHDGQAFGSLALDPLLTRSTEWGGGKSEMAYRAARPLLGWAVMVTSFGLKAAVEWGLLVWSAIGIGILAAGALVLANHWGRRGDWVPLLLLLPAVAGQVMFGGLSDALATGLALLGLAWWLEDRDRWAIVALSLAALGRETTLLVPLALLLASLPEARRQRAARLLLPFGAYAAWVGVVWLRIGALPTDAHRGRLALPPANFGAVIGSWSWVEVLGAATIVLLAAVAWWGAPGREVRWLVVLSALFAATLGPDVLRSWDFTRPLLPVTVVGACLLAPKMVEIASRKSPPRSSGTGRPAGILGADDSSAIVISGATKVP